MRDERDRLSEWQALAELLADYLARQGGEREAWLDRPLAIAGLDAQEVTRLHGELLAYGWLEMQLNPSGPRRADTVAECYRLTPAGRRAALEQ